MSNSYTSPPTLVDPSRMTAGLTIRSTEMARLADLQNYLYATGGTHNVVSQMFDDSCCIQDSTSYVQMAQWRIPIISAEHTVLNINVQGFCPGAANGTVKFDLTVGASNVIAEISITDGGRYTSAFNSGTITISGSTVETGILRMSAKAPTGSQLTLLGVQANWQAPASPLNTGTLSQTSHSFIPQGQTRQGADEPLPARFGVEALRNINTLRRRQRVLFCWSGIEGASSTSPISAAAAPPRAIGRGDLSSFYSPSAIFAGTIENDLTVKCYIRALNYSVPFSILIMGNVLTISAGGWSEFTLDLIQDELDVSDQFALSMYRAGVDTGNLNINGVASPTYPPSTTGYVASIAIIGV